MNSVATSLSEIAFSSSCVQYRWALKNWPRRTVLIDETTFR
jgi:hypothetical protein